ncbi:pilin [Streptomyces sp. C8S0]|uniref:pilin n=1 Tax=Streptomyces sp. C8S0 TaxID=2585716 RepID=UPI0039AF752B
MVTVLGALSVTLAEAPLVWAVADIPTVITNLRNWIIGILAGAATLFMTFGGLRYLMAGGDPGEVEASKRALKAAAIGYGWRSSPPCSSPCCRASSERRSRVGARAMAAVPVAGDERRSTPLPRPSASGCAANSCPGGALRAGRCCPRRGSCSLAPAAPDPPRPEPQPAPAPHLSRPWP